MYDKELVCEILSQIFESTQVVLKIGGNGDGN